MATAIPRESILTSLDALARASNTSNFQDAMELVWFSFDPRKGGEMFDQMSLLITAVRNNLDGNIRPPLDLAAMYRDIYRTTRGMI